MWEEIVKAITMVMLPSMLKFIFGPFAGKAGGLHFLTTAISTALGMMISVFAFTYFGEFIRTRILRKLVKKKKDVPPLKNKSIVARYGLAGIAFFTPILLTPIGGTLLAVSFTRQKEKIILYMSISAIVWSFIFTTAVYVGYEAIMKLIE
jgi:membrane protein DedA with SNARE-associated domain